MTKVAWVMELKEDKVDEYVRLHKRENVWPEIVEVNRKAGVLKEEIFLFKNLVFLYLEVEDYETMMRVFETDDGLRRWNRVTLPMSKSTPDLQSTMQKLTRVFDYEDGKLLHD
jgi:L-rhamnose mutarotase